MDRIFIENLALKGTHGVHEHERLSEQEFLVSIVADIDTKTAAESDDIADTTDYGVLCKIAQGAVEKNSFHLIERLADTIAHRILDDARIARVEVTVRKPKALEGGIPGVTIVRTRA